MSIDVKDPNWKWALINSALAGALVLLGAISSGQVTTSSIFYAVVVGLVATITQFKKFWEKQEGHLFSFISF